MARKEFTYVVPSAGRDKDKVFHITEMDAERAEKWAIRLFLALAASNVNIPDNIATAGMAGVASLTLRMIGGLSYELAEPLLDEMMGCVHIVPDPRETRVHRPLVADDVEEVKTRFELRQEVLKLHTDFSWADALSRFGPASAKTDQSSPSTQTSRRR